MKLSEMTAYLENEAVDIQRTFDFTVNKLCSNSEEVEQNDIFFAIKGANRDGNKFVADALERGANAVFTDGEPGLTDSRIYRVSDVRKTMATLSGAFYGFPSKNLKMVGVTGTNGKTTITSIINYVLQRAGKKTGLIGTNGNYINKRFIKTVYTTPDAIVLNGLLKEMADEQVEYVVMEVSSHSLSLKRVYGIEFDAAVFTNLTPEHLDFHRDMNEYFTSKKMLFDSLGRIGTKGITPAAIYNCNDEFGARMVSNSPAERIAYGFGCGTYTAKDLDMNFRGMKFSVLVPHNGEAIDKISVKTRLTGKFNVHNILAAIAALKVLGMKYSEITEYISEFEPVDGRFNLIKLANGAQAVIDYSHTPDSLQKAIEAIREILDENNAGGRIITVFGCGGNRDKAKRPLMGAIAAKLSSEVIITSDNPRYEEPLSIIEDIKSGITSDNYSVEENRELAIQKAAELSKKGDVILIAGKGHETYQEIKGTRFHLSDKEIVERYC